MFAILTNLSMVKVSHRVRMWHKYRKRHQWCPEKIPVHVKVLKKALQCQAPVYSMYQGERALPCLGFPWPTRHFLKPTILSHYLTVEHSPFLLWSEIQQARGNPKGHGCTFEQSQAGTHWGQNKGMPIHVMSPDREGSHPLGKETL